MLFFRILGWTKFKRTALFEIEIFCNIINVFTATFDQFNASLQKKSINFLQKNLADLKLLKSSVFL